MDDNPFYCINCGSTLHESGLGFLGCSNCKSQFLPSVDEDGNQILTDTTGDE